MESNARWNQLSISEVNEFTFHQKDCQTEENETDKHPPTLPWIQSVCCYLERVQEKVSGLQFVEVEVNATPRFCMILKYMTRK